MKKFILMVTILLGAATVHAATSVTDPCGGLSAMEQSFAQGMTAANREMFCMRFSQSMRDTTMNMSAKPDRNGNMMTPDQVVEKIARENNITPMSGTAGGGCGVK